MRIKRREFLKGTAGAAAAYWVLPAVSGVAAASAKPGKNGGDGAYQPSWYLFTGHPDADTCWSVSVGPDGRIYAAACAESVPGGVVKVGGGWGLAPSTIRTTTMLAAWTSSASLICWYWGWGEASLATCSPHA